MSYTMEDFTRDYIKEHFSMLTCEEQREALARLSAEHLREVLQSLPPEDRMSGLSPKARLAGLTEEQVRQLAEELTASGARQPRKPRRKR
jgi:hypothetical protein